MNAGPIFLRRRVMHGRKAFEGNERTMSGCYIDRIEVASKARVLGIEL
jgi:alpha-ketoglutarate-dependent taurine dioxygenase